METTIKRHYTKIDEKILVQALGEGKTYIEAGKLAGIKSKSLAVVSDTIGKKIQKNTELKKSILEKMEEVREAYLDSMRGEDISKVPVNQRAITLAILTDKIQLLKGDPTMIMQSIPRMVFESGIEEKQEQKKESKEVKKEDKEEGIEKE